MDRKMDRKVLRFGILGCGHIATKMAAAVKKLESLNRGVEAYAVGSRTLEKAEKFASDYQFKKAYGSYLELAQDPKVDLIYIATPHSEHFNDILLCLEQGKNLLVEKAFTANALLASQAIALAEEKGVFLCEAMWTRFLPAVQMVKDWILAGRIGKVEGVEADFSMPLTHVERLRNPALAGGALLDLGIYSLTFADIFLTDPQIGGSTESGANHIVETKSKCVQFETGVDATDWIDLVYKNGQVAHLKTSMVAPLKNEGVIYGTDGFIRVQNLNDMVEIQLFDKAGTLVESKEPPRIENCYEYEVLACCDAIEKGLLECAAMPHAKTMQMMTQMDSLRQSWGVSYPFELSPAQVWDRSGNKSFLEVFDIETGEAKRLKEFDGVIEAPNWSADGRFLTYNSEGRIYRYELNSGKITQAYCAERNGEYDIYTIPAEGGNETRLTFALGLNDGPEYDCDGEYIWFNSVRTGRMQAWRMKADGSEQQQMTIDSHWNTWFPHISPDRRKVVMLAYHESDVRPGEHVPNKDVEIRLMEGSDSAGWSRPRTILKLFGGQGTINVNSWAPDSRRFAFVRYAK